LRAKFRAARDRMRTARARYHAQKTLEREKPAHSKAMVPPAHEEEEPPGEDTMVMAPAALVSAPMITPARTCMAVAAMEMTRSTAVKMSIDAEAAGEATSEAAPLEATESPPPLGSFDESDSDGEAIPPMRPSLTPAPKPVLQGEFCDERGMRHSSGIHPIVRATTSAMRGNIFAMRMYVRTDRFPLAGWRVHVDFNPALLAYENATFNPVYFKPTVAASDKRVVVSTPGSRNAAGTAGGQTIFLAEVRFSVKADAPREEHSNAISVCADELMGNMGVQLGKNLRFTFPSGTYAGKLQVF